MSDDEESSSSSGEEVEEEEEEEEEEVTDLSNSDVCTKYQEASKIVNLALRGLVAQCAPGAKIVDLCKFGSTVIETQASKLYTKKVNGKTVERGVAFPVCVSVNEVVCNCSPLESEETEPLKEGDVVKLDLGCHIDGYIAVAAHTIVVPAGPDAPPTVAADDSLGDVAVAAYHAMLVAAHAVRAGASNADVTAAVAKVAAAYGTAPVSSVRMHQTKRFVIDGVKEVALKDPTPEELAEGSEEKVTPCTFEQNEVYAVDVAMSDGDGRARPGDSRTTVFKRNVESTYRLRMKASRHVLSEVDKKYPTLPFTLRHFEDERQARMGITECVSHGLVVPYPSLHEKPGVKVAHFKCSVLLLPSGTVRTTGLDLPPYFASQKQVDDDTKQILEDIAAKAAKKAKKKAAKKKKKKN